MRTQRASGASGGRTRFAERRTLPHRSPSPALPLQRAAGNRAVTALLAGPGVNAATARDRQLLALAVQRQPSRVRFIDPSQYERGDRPPGSREPASMDPSTVRLPTADTDPQVSVDDEDTKECSLRPRSTVLRSPSYLDNEVVSVGAEITDIWTIGIQAFTFKTRSGGDVRVPLDEVDFDDTSAPARYVTRGGVTFPVRADGRIAFNHTATPRIVQGALMKLQEQEQLRGERLVMAQTVMAFQLTLANLAASVAPHRIAASLEGLAPRVTQRGASGARVGIGASGEGGKGAWFNPRGLRDNCVGGVCAVIKTGIARRAVTEAEIAKQFGETSRTLTGKSLDLVAARNFITKATGRSLSKTAVQLDQRGLEPGTYVVFGGQTTKSLVHVVYATVKRGGRVVIYDPQVGTKWTWFSFIGKFGRGSRAYRVVTE